MFSDFDDEPQDTQHAYDYDPSQGRTHVIDSDGWSIGVQNGDPSGVPSGFHPSTWMQNVHIPDHDNRGSTQSRNISTVDIAIVRNILKNQQIRTMCVSPYSLKMVLIPLMYGLKKSSDIYSKMTKFLQLPSNMNENELTSLITNNRNKIQQLEDVNMYSTILINDIYQLQPEYVKLVSAFLDDITAISPTEVVKRVNTLAEKHTRGKIKEVLKDGDIDKNLFALAIMNIIHFKDDWVNKFEPSYTKSKPFTTSRGKHVLVPQMYHKFETTDYYENDQFQMIELPFEHSCVFGVILPNSTSSVNQIKLSKLNEHINRMKLNFVKYNVGVQLPKFKQEIELDLVEYLKPMLPELFAGGYFDRMVVTERKDLCVGKFVQKVSFEIDETGAEGSAVTVAVLSFRCTPHSSTPFKKFTADHTFIYYIRNTITNGILFYGIYDGN
jgi:serine protease inhibitor